MTYSINCSTLYGEVKLKREGLLFVRTDENDGVFKDLATGELIAIPITSVTKEED
jgi:hypothetical protein